MKKVAEKIIYEFIDSLRKSQYVWEIRKEILFFPYQEILQVLLNLLFERCRRKRNMYDEGWRQKMCFIDSRRNVNTEINFETSAEPADAVE